MSAVEPVETMHPATRPTPRAAALVLLVWTTLGALFALQDVLQQRFNGRQVEQVLVSAVAAEISSTTVWALLTPLVAWLTRRFNFVRGHRLRSALVHAGAGLGLAMLKPLSDAAIGLLVGWPPGIPNPTLGLLYRVLVLYGAFSALLTYGALVGVLLALEASRLASGARELQTRLAQAQVQVLRAQLQPHFLFNTLQGISTLMHRDVALADRMLQRLSELLRRLLEAGGAQQVSVQTELELLDTYLDIEHARLGERLRVEVDVPPAMLQLQVPSMVLQPLVENAIRHGIALLPEGGRVEVRASHDGTGMRWEVLNDGPAAGADGAAPRGQGIGLDNTRKRLLGLYGAGASLQAGPVPRGWSVRLTIPEERSP